MLKYKLNIKDKTEKVIEVKYEAIYLSQDASYLTGFTDISYGLSQKQLITVTSKETQECSLIAEDVTYCGYTIYQQKYKVEDYGNTIGILYNDGQYYCVDKDFQSNKELYVENDTLKDGYQKPFIIVGDYTVEIGKWDYDENNNPTTIIWYDDVIIPTKYYAFDNKIEIDNKVYNINIDVKTSITNNNYYPYIVLNDMSKDDVDKVLYILDWEHNKQKKVTKFKITSNTAIPLHLTNAFCMQYNAYFDNITLSGVTRHYASEYESYEKFVEDTYSKKQNIAFEWKKVSQSNVIDLYVNGNINLIPSSALIYLKPFHNKIKLKTYKLDENKTDIEFDYYGKKIVCEKDENGGLLYKSFVINNNNEYEIYNSDNCEKYIIFNKRPLKVQEEMSIKDYPYIIINNNICIVKEINSKFYEVEIPNSESFPLIISERFGNNILRCQPLDEIDISLLFRSLSNNINSYMLEAKTPLFDLSLIQPLKPNDKDYISFPISLYTNHSSFSIPINFESTIAINTHKDFVVSQYEIEEEKNSLINRIVDMEKDIYYPARLEKKNGKDILTLCHQLQFDLHFRTRDLETWVINDENDIDEYGGKYRSTWNIFDSYRFNTDNNPNRSMQPILRLTNDLRYYPPSDLLYFLNFTNEDVFYQKEKIGKSFLRLSFYDSKNPNQQNLLYYTTIFMSESELFKKYINAEKNNEFYITLKDRGITKVKKDENGKEISEYYTDDYNIVQQLSVSTEPCENNKNKKLTFNEDKRLSSSFIVKNRNECVESSDGFYLYLFKEYSNWLHERSIYMRVQFNHAGLGKTINFMLLYHQNGDNKSMIDWSSKFNYDKYKNGCALNELYDHLYIEIKVKYDLENKRFCYYLPEWMSEKNSDKNVMRLSLFEIKIKDESKE